MHFLRKIAFMAFLTPFAFIQADVEEVIVTANKKVETVQEIPCLLYTPDAADD